MIFYSRSEVSEVSWKWIWRRKKKQFGTLGTYSISVQEWQLDWFHSGYKLQWRPTAIPLLSLHHGSPSENRTCRRFIGSQWTPIGLRGGSFRDLATNDPSQARGPKTRSQPAKPRCVGNSGSHGFFWGPFWLLHFPALWAWPLRNGLLRFEKYLDNDANANVSRKGCRPT